MKWLKTFFMLAVALAILLSISSTARADTASPVVAAQAGTQVTLALAIANDTAATRSYELAAAGLPAGAAASFVESGPVVTTVSVGAYSKATVTLRVGLPADVQIKRYESTFLAHRDDGTTVQMPFILDVANTYAIKIVDASKNISTFSGQDFNLDIAVVNSGVAAVTNLKALTEMPPKWVLASDPPSIASLAPGKQAVFHLKVTVPASQVAIEQPVKVSVGSDQVSSSAGSTSVRVQNNPVYLPIAGGVVLIALVALVIYFRRKGRR